jgi:hypothetical protein
VPKACIAQVAGEVEGKRMTFKKFRAGQYAFQELTWHMESGIAAGFLSGSAHGSAFETALAGNTSSIPACRNHVIDLLSGARKWFAMTLTAIR